MVDIIHFSTVHFRDDSRIRSKMLASLQERYPGRVSLLVQDGLGDEVDEAGYRVVDTGPRLRRLRRMSSGGWRMLRAVLRQKPRIAHFHDPELIPWGVLLSLFGIKVIYDVHEDYPEAVSRNYRLPRLMRRVMPPVVRIVERATVPFFGAIVTVTPHIQKRFPENKSVLVRNWPRTNEFRHPTHVRMRPRPAEFVYLGTITRDRNILGMIDALVMVQETGATLRLAGDFTIKADREAALEHPGWNQVIFEGWVSRARVAEILGSVCAGLVVLQPIERFKFAYPIKLFEYMAAGVPVIASDFPLWREIVDNAGCGLLVDPDKPEEIAAAMRWMLENPDDAEAMGRRGRAAVLEQFNWEQEAETLIETYETLLGR